MWCMLKSGSIVSSQFVLRRCIYEYLWKYLIYNCSQMDLFVDV